MCTISHFDTSFLYLNHSHSVLVGNQDNDTGVIGHYFCGYEL